jgi:hypothetical protein
MFSEKFSLKKTFAESYNPLCVGNPGPPKLYGTRKVVQLTGDTDRERGTDTPNQTGKRYQVYGTDLGISFVHDGKLFFLFGDTTRRGTSEGLPKTALPGTHFNEDETDYDAIAFTTSDSAYNGISLVFNSAPPVVDNISQMTAETPIEGFSIGHEMYVYFATDMFEEKRIFPQRTVLAKSGDGGYRFGNSIYTLSTDKFIHVSVQIVENSRFFGLPRKTGKGLLLWGTGKYRQSDTYLAYMPLEEITNRDSILFFTGFDSNTRNPSWEPDEGMARPLFSASCVGELSVRWNHYLEKWIMLYNCDLCNTNGVVVRLASNPWGPWSASKIVFDNTDGYTRFLHVQGQDNLHDTDRDDKTNPFDLGYSYGPYQMAPYATGVKGRYSKIYFTLSTWNPYQVIQMSAIILSEEEEEKGSLPYASRVSDRNDRKYAYISVLIAHLASSKKTELKNTFGTSTYIADHIEWAQFHSHLELRKELKDKVHQFLGSLKADTEKADAFAAIYSSVVRLGYDYELFNPKGVNASLYRKWAIDTVHSGNTEWLTQQIKQEIDSEGFLPDHDHLCYAYGPEDANEFKYARISRLQGKLAQQQQASAAIGQDKQHDDDGKTTRITSTTTNTDMVANSYVAWARFRDVEELRQDLISKLNQTVQSITNQEEMIKACVHINNAVTELSVKKSTEEEEAIATGITSTGEKGNDGGGGGDSYNMGSMGSEEISSKIKSGNLEQVVEKISKYIQSDLFLVPLPTNNVTTMK